MTVHHELNIIINSLQCNCSLFKEKCENIKISKIHLTGFCCWCTGSSPPSWLKESKIAPSPYSLIF